MYSSVSTIWVLLGAALVFLMQAGFAMCEAGFTRAKNTGNILMKNLMDFCIGTPTYWLLGFGLMFAGSGAIIGGLDPFVRGDYSAVLPAGVPLFAYLIFQTSSAPRRPPSSPGLWRSGPGSFPTASTLSASPPSSIPFPATGSGAAAGWHSSVSTILPDPLQYIW